MTQTRSLGLLMALSFVSLSLAGQQKQLEQANLLFQKSKYIAAIDAYEKAFALNQRKNKISEEEMSLARHNLAKSYKLTGNTILAEDQYEMLVSDYADNAEMLFEYARVLQNNHRYKKAKEYFEKYIELNPIDETGPVYAKLCEQVITKNFFSDAFDIQEMKINSEYSDFGPAFFNEALVFASTRNAPSEENNRDWTGEGFSDIYIAEGDGSGYYSKMRKFGNSNINSKVNEGSPTFDRECKTIYFSRNYFVNGKLSTSGEDINKLVILRSKLEDSEWSKVEVLTFNSIDYNCTHPCLSPDGSRLYFASDMPEGYGGMDLYYVEEQGGDWGEPVNLGSTINTSGNEVFPFLHKDSTLFFSSDGHVGIGGLDLFYAELDESGSEWNEPINLREPINSAKDDFAMILNDEKDVGFLSSSRKGDDDIYQIFRKGDVSMIGKEQPEVVMEEEPEDTTGKYASETGEGGDGEEGYDGDEGDVFDRELDPTRRVIPELIYSVQIGLYKNDVSSIYLNAVSAFPADLRIVNQDGLDRYLVGRFDNLEEAQAAKAQLQELFSDAFLQVYHQGQSIPMSRAMELMYEGMEMPSED